MVTVGTAGEQLRRDLRVAAIIFGIGMLAIAIGLTGDLAWIGPESAWWQAVPLAVGCIAVAAQSRWPRTALVVGVACLLLDGGRAWSLGPILVAWEVLYTAAMRMPWPWVHRLRRAAIGLAAVITIVVAIAARDIRTVADVGLVAFAVLGTPLWWGVDVRRQADMARLIEQSAERERDQAVQAERARMARDLHDAVAGDLASIALHAEAGLRQTTADQPAHTALDTIRRSGLRAMDELSTMIHLLRRDAGDEVVTPPGLDSLDELVGHAEAAGLRVVVERTVPEALPRAVDHAAYRILQEAFTNAARHGGPGDVRVRLGGRQDLEIEMVSTADGPVPPTPHGSGLGLLTMRERAEGLGGDFESGQHGDEWRVCARIPLAS